MKKISLIYVICVWGSLCVSCQKEGIEYNLKGIRVKNDSVYGGFSPMMLHDNLLISKVFSRQVLCVVNELNDGYLRGKKELFNIGNGRNEFHKVAVADGSDSSLYVLDYPNTGNKLLSLTKIESAIGIDSLDITNKWEQVSLMDIQPFRCVFDTFVWLSDSTFLVPGAPYNEIGHIMSIVNYKSQTVTPLNYWPKDNVSGDSLAKHSVYTDNCRIYSNNNERFLYVCGEERFAFIFSINNGTIEIEKELYSTLPDYKCAGDGNYVINARSRKSLLADVNDNKIYAFLVNWESQGNYISRFGNIVEVYDWNGTLERILKLDKQGDCIKVSKNNDILYLFTSNPSTDEKEIWMYDLRTTEKVENP